MMKLSTAIVAAAVGSSSASRFTERTIDLGAQDIKAGSKLGNKLLAGARRLDGDNNDDYSWVSGYSLKFQGCHHISQWNEEANGEDEPKIQTKRLVRFRLCTTGSCTYEDASGCDSGYGDYIIDMNIFLEAYIQNKMEQQEYQCEYAENYVCGNCENANNAEYCRYDCFVENGLDFCNEDNPYVDDDNGNEQFELDRYMECADWDVPNNGRKLEDGDQGYFIGPYCSDQGGKIHLGVFTDEFCTNFADDEDNGWTHTEFYYKLTGESLPYSSESLIGMDCISCKENNGNGNNNNNNNNGNGNIDPMCEEIYQQAGKCESSLSPNSYYFSANENACSYIEGIKIVRSDGIVVQSAATKSKTAAICIGVFAAVFVLLGAYVYYLKTKLDRAKVNLSE